MSERKRIAVVGSGVAGLSAAYLLAREHDVTIFEREAAVGMDAHSLDAHGARMDIPLRVFSESYYPNLCSLYRRIGVKYRAADYSFSCLGGHAGAAAYFRYINFFVRGMALPLPMCLNPLQVLKCVRLAAQFAHFVNMSPSKLAATTAEPSLDAFLKAEGYSEEFATQLLYPMLSVVCTCSYAAVAAYPASIVIDYFANKYGLSGSQCRAYEGTRDVVTRLTADVTRVVTSATITSIEAAEASGSTEAARSAPAPSAPYPVEHPSPSEPTQAKAAPVLRWRSASGEESVEVFDEVVLAMQANASRRVLRTGVAEQQKALAGFAYESNRVILHTDSALMPSRRRDWSPLNIIVDAQASAASVTVWMNRIDAQLRSELAAPVFQTWNPILEPQPSKLIADFSFERPVVTPASQQCMAALHKSQGQGHVWFVGAYSRYSMPLLENGVKSAMEVARALGVTTSDLEVDEEQLSAAAASANTARNRLWLGVAAASLVATLAYRSRA